MKIRIDFTLGRSKVYELKTGNANDSAYFSSGGGGAFTVHQANGPILTFSAHAFSQITWGVD